MNRKNKDKKVDKKKDNKILYTALGIIVLGLVGYFAFRGTSDNIPGSNISDTEYIDEEISEEPDVGITAEDILDDPEAYDGLEVVLRAEVEEWLNSRAFLLDAQGIVDDSLLVITKDPTYVFEDPELFGDSIWEVQGEVDRFEEVVVTDLDLDFEPELVSLYEGSPYVVADSIELYED